jgi:hypothetical protein
VACSDALQKACHELAAKIETEQRGLGHPASASNFP